MKLCALVVSGRPGGGVQEVELHPGTTAGDVLNAAGLGDDYVLSVEGQGLVLAKAEPVYDLVPEGGKFRAAPTAVVGNDLAVFSN